MSKPIILTEQNWAKLHYRLAQENHSSVMLIREKMKVVLGFTVRRHREWVNFTASPNGKKRPVDFICLDFYNEPKRTMFLLKYGDYLEKSGKTVS